MLASKCLYSLYAWLLLLSSVHSRATCHQPLNRYTVSQVKPLQTTVQLGLRRCGALFVICQPPLPSNRYHQSNDDCLEGKRENYQVCSVQYCVQQLYTVNCIHTWTDITVLWIGFCLTGPISLCLDSFLCMYYFVPDYILHAYVVL